MRWTCLAALGASAEAATRHLPPAVRPEAMNAAVRPIAQCGPWPGQLLWPRDAAPAAVLRSPLGGEASWAQCGLISILVFTRWPWEAGPEEKPWGGASRSLRRSVRLLSP